MSALLRTFVPVLAIASTLAFASPAVAKAVPAPTGPEPSPVWTVLLVLVGVESTVAGLL